MLMRGIALTLMTLCAFNGLAAAWVDADNLVAASDALKLYLNPNTTEMAVYDRQGSVFWYSNPPARDTEETVARGINRDLLAAQLTMAFYGPDDRLYTLNSYTHSAAWNQFVIHPLENGVRVEYQLMEDWGEVAVPRMASGDVFEEGLLAGLSSTDQERLRELYVPLILTKKPEGYERVSVFGVDKEALFGDYTLGCPRESSWSEDEKREYIRVFVDLLGGIDTLGSSVEHELGPGAGRLGEAAIHRRGSLEQSQLEPLLEQPLYLLRSGLRRWDLADLTAIVHKAIDLGNYTPLETAAMHTRLGLNQFEALVTFTIPIEYVLDDDELVVRIPTSQVSYPEGVRFDIDSSERAEYRFLGNISRGRSLDRTLGSILGANVSYPLHRIAPLPFFGAAGPDADGYIVVPDGSGALIHLNNGKTSAPAYSQPVFGRDTATMPMVQRPLGTEVIHLPVFGLKNGGSAFMAIISSGEAVSRITADVAGRLNSYNTCGAVFTVINRGSVLLDGPAGHSLNTYQDRIFHGDLELRYAFLHGQNADYVGMAHYYQDYLAEQYGLRQLPSHAATRPPLYLELVGAISAARPVYGIPLERQIPLTTFREMAAIMEAAAEQNDGQVVLRVSGWLNGGLSHFLPHSGSHDPVLGSMRDLQFLLDRAAALDARVYFDANLLTVNRTRLADGFVPRTDAARFLNRESAQVYDYSYVTHEAVPGGYVLAPHRLEKLVQDFLTALQARQISGISLRDLTNQLGGDYRRGEEFVDRGEAQEQISNQLQMMQNEGFSLMGESSHAYALPLLNDIVNVPVRSSGYAILDEDIPFLPIVLRGYWDYAALPLNLGADWAEDVLRMIAAGAYPQFSWSYAPSYLTKSTGFSYLHSTHYADWLEQCRHLQQLLGEIYRGLYGVRIETHAQKGVGRAVTTYADGTRLSVDIHAGRVVVEREGFETEFHIREELSMF